MEGEIISHVPVIGLAFKVMKALDSVRDRMFAAKIVKFLEPLHGASAERIVTFKAKLQSNREETSRVGETLLLVLDRVTALDKSYILGCIFVAYLDEIVTDPLDAYHAFHACTSPMEQESMERMVHA